MNYLFFVILILSTHANASGFRCSSNCILIDPRQNDLYLLGRISNDADLPKDQLFDLLSQGCASRAQKLGLTGQTSLAREVRQKETETSIQEPVVYQRFGRILSTQSQTTIHSKEVWIDFDRAESACQPDASIPRGTTPLYPGSLPFKG